MRTSTGIRAFRKEKGLTQAQLAERLGVPRPLLSYWENGKMLPDYSQVKDMARELDCTVGDLYRPAVLDVIQRGT